MLETIRQYGEERLTDWGETDTLTIRHGRFYTDLLVRTGEPKLLRALTKSMGKADQARARQHPLSPGAMPSTPGTRQSGGADRGEPSTPIQGRGTYGRSRLAMPASPVLGIRREPPKSPDIPWCYWLAAYDTQAKGDLGRSRRSAGKRSKPRRALTPIHARPSDRDGYLQPAGQIALAAATMPMQSRRTAGPPNWRAPTDIPGLPRIFLARMESTARCSGASEPRKPWRRAEEAVALARQSGMPGAIVLTLNSLALALVDHDPARAESRFSGRASNCGSTPGRGNLVGCSHRLPCRRPASGLEPHARAGCPIHAAVAMEQWP